MRAYLAAFLAIAAPLSFVGSTCDPSSDECAYRDPNSSYCTSDNVAVSCVRPGAEVHAREQRDSCGPERVCALDKDHRAFCARANDAACPISQEAALDAGVGWIGRAVICSDAGHPIETTAICTETLDGGRVWADRDCGHVYWRNSTSCQALDNSPCNPLPR